MIDAIEISKEIKNLMETRSFPAISAMLRNQTPQDTALIFAELPEESIPVLFRILPKDQAAETFVEMDYDRQEYLIRSFSDKELKAVFEELFLDDTVDIIEEMPANVVRRILKNTDLETRNAINEVLKYPDDSAGSIMTIEYVDLKRNMTVAQAFERIRSSGLDKETVYTCYVTEHDHKLLGIITVRTMLLADPQATMESLMETHIISVNTLEDKEEVAKLFNKYDFLAIPVVDQENRLLGIVTVDDAMDVLQEENTEDIVKMAAMQPTETTYLKTPTWVHSKKRLPWLLILMISAAFTGMIITRYEEAFEAIPLLVSFIPQLMNTAGNCGNQSSTIIIRGLALDEIRFRDYFRVVFKEVRVALICSLALAIVNAIYVMIIYRDAQLALVLGATLVVTIILAKILGCSLPMLAKRLKLDPAIMASPLITTIVDACSILTYFAIATQVFAL